VFRRVRALIRLRQQLPVLGKKGETHLHTPGNDHLFVYERRSEDDGLLVLANFDAGPQVVNASWLGRLGYISEGVFHNLADDSRHSVHSGLLEVGPYALVWLRRNQL
jgi:amylosucrase